MIDKRRDGAFEVQTVEIIERTTEGVETRTDRRVWNLRESVDYYRVAYKRANKWWVTEYDEDEDVDNLRAGPLDTLKAAKVVLLMLGPTTDEFSI